MPYAKLRLLPRHLSDQHFRYIFRRPYIFRISFTMFICWFFFDIMYLVLLLFNENLLILSQSLTWDSSLLIYDVLFVFVSS